MTKEALALLICEGLQEQFFAERNPLYAWDAYRIARQAKVTVPEWVAVYFDRCAGKLAADADPQVALGLGTKGGHSKAAQKRSRSRDIGIFARVEVLLNLTPQDLGDPEPREDPKLALIRRLLLTKVKTKRGASSWAERVFTHVAWETRQQDHEYPDVRQPLSAKTVASIYYRLKKR